MEIEIRINKIFDILEKIEFIEEQVLFFLYISIYKYGTKSYFIKMFEFINRFMGYSSYTNLLYMCLKLNQKEKYIKENNNNEISSEDKEQIKIRSFVDINELKKNLDFIKYESSGDLNLSKELSGSGIQKEEIVYQIAIIIWKLLNIKQNLIDQELAKNFIEKDGHESVIEILFSMIKFIIELVKKGKNYFINVMNAERKNWKLK